uniref:Uncharacterized protein n=1 Tax=Helianthus annuus TaxID=4232 RepID=A0A251SZ65_HELAN
MGFRHDQRHRRTQTPSHLRGRIGRTVQTPQAPPPPPPPPPSAPQPSSQPQAQRYT